MAEKSAPLSLRAERPGRRLGTLLMGSNALFAALLCGLVMWVLSSSRQNHEERARTTAESLVAVTGANVGSELGLIDAVLRMTLDDLLRSGFGSGAADEGIQRLLDERRSLLEGAEGFRLADEKGSVRWGNLEAGAPVADISHRAFFQQARQATSGDPIVSRPVVSQISGNWVIVIARPLAANGQFAGVLYATIRVDHFAQLFHRYELGERDAITLRTRDLRFVAWMSPGNEVRVEVGSTQVSDELRATLATNPASGVYTATSAADGVERTVAYREVQGWPFIVFAGLNNQHFFQPLAQEARMLCLLAGLMWLLSCAAAFVVYRLGLRELGTLRALEAQSRRTQILLRVAGDGIHILDRQGHLVEMSDSFAQMHRSSREGLQGRHVSSWDANQNEAAIRAWLVKVRDGDRQRVEVQHRRADGQVIDVDLHWHAVDIDGQLLIFGSARDITDRQRLLQSLEESGARIRDLYDHAPCGYFSLDAEGCVVHINATLQQWLGGTPVESHTRFSDLLQGASRLRFHDHFIVLTLQEQAPEIEVELAPPGAERRFVRINATAVRDAQGNFLMSRTVAIDVTAQHQALQQVQTLLHDQSAMLNSDLVGMVKLRDRTITWKNAAMERMLGHAPGELDGAQVQDLYAHGQDHRNVENAAALRLDRGQNFRTDVRLQHKSGDAIWVDLSGVRLSDRETFWMAVDISAAKRAHEQITHVAFHDALTQLPNRLLLLDRLRQALAAAQRAGHGVAVCFADLDGFKAVNDQLGHEAGDQLLVELAGRVRGSIRASDTAARIGGDEFVLVLTPVAGDEWRAVLDRLMQAACQPVQLPGSQAPVQVGMSIGVALSRGRLDAQELLAEADAAMLQAKRSGKHRVQLAQGPQAAKSTI